MDEAFLERRIGDFNRKDFGSPAYLRKCAPLHELMDFLEPRHPIECAWGHYPLVCYLRRSFFWREVLLYLAPELQSCLALQELEYKRFFRVLLKVCDLVYKPEKEIITFAAFMLFSHEIPCLKTSRDLVPSSASHLESVLQSRLKVLCAIVFKADQVNATKSSALHGLGVLINESEGLSSYLPPGDWTRPLQSKRNDTSPHGATASPSIPACLLSRLESSKQWSNASPSGVCYCGWVVDIIPSFILASFGHSPESLMLFVHDPEILPPLGAILRLQMQQEFLPEILPLFLVVFQFTLRYSCFEIRKLIAGGYDRQSEDQDHGRSECHRQLLLVFTIPEAIFICRKYLTARRNQVVTKSIDGSRTDFYSWVQHSNFTLESLNKLLGWLHNLRKGMDTERGWDETSLEVLGIDLLIDKIERGDVPVTVINI
jgi:hypothetical protein